VGFIDRNKLPPHLQEKYDKVEELSNSYMSNMYCILQHEGRMMQIKNELKPLVIEVLKHVLGEELFPDDMDNEHMDIFDDFLKGLEADDT
jgi:hypothetical protein